MSDEQACSNCRKPGARGGRRECMTCEGLRNRDSVDRMSDLVRELKGGVPSDRERELTKSLESMGHPDVAGLLKAIEDRKTNPQPPQRRGGRQ